MVMTEHEIFSCLAEIVEQVAGIAAGRVTHEADITDDLDISSLSLVEIIVPPRTNSMLRFPMKLSRISGLSRTSSATCSAYGAQALA